MLLAPACVAMALGGCGATDSGPEAPPKVTVTVTDSGYKPVRVRIPRGGRVTWVNVSSGGQTANSEHVPEVMYDRSWLVEHKMFDTHTMQPGEAETVVFPRSGRYFYFSSLDPENVGLVTVAKER